MRRAARALAYVAVALAGCGGDDCPDRFDAAAWRSAGAGSAERVKLARQIERCGFLHGESKQRVAELLGRAARDETQYRSEYRREWKYPLADTGDYMGPADLQILSVQFNRRGRVQRVSVDP